MDWITLKKTHDAIARQAFDIFLQHQSLDPQIIIMRSESNRMVVMPSHVVWSMYEEESGKCSLSNLIHSIADPSGESARTIESQYGFLPDAVVQIHEARHGDQARAQDCVVIVLHAAEIGSIHVTHPVAHEPHPHVMPATFPGPEALDSLRGRFLIPGAKDSSPSSRMDSRMDGGMDEGMATLDDHEMVSRP